jgi:hypothetical protein
VRVPALPCPARRAFPRCSPALALLTHPLFPFSRPRPGAALPLTLSYARSLTRATQPETSDQTEARPRYRSRSTPPSYNVPLCLPTHPHLTSTTLSASSPLPLILTMPPPSPIYGLQQLLLASPCQRITASPRKHDRLRPVSSTRPHVPTARLQLPMPYIVFLFPIPHFP